MTVLKLIEWLGLTEAGIKVFEDSDWNEQRAARTGQGIRMMIACCGEILKEKKMFLSRRTSVFDSLKSSSGTPHRHLNCWTMEMIIQMTCLQLKRMYHLLKLQFSVRFHIFFL
jgi:hypothetical protein